MFDKLFSQTHYDIVANNIINISRLIYICGNINDTNFKLCW
ncbi:MAG: hypothetical protein P857_704 [Candidatus Xenolissoclinum pacificiensis L6]|uniref:Uncharacterized protein n=1 Tax=Candidatus Xenolissoclinum pacificiensis L6 TaxID=1401685 RepID=W2UZ51_9RICK|nr:MAG: hypothetical protein P857_704 [Candidatus Xenolissoclinum pacificiensis L6]